MKKFKLSLSLQEIEKISQGKLILVNEISIDSVDSLDEGKSSAAVFYQDEKFKDQLLNTNAGVVFIPENIDISNFPKRNYILTKNPYESFLRLVTYFLQSDKKILHGQNIHPNANIHSSAILSENIQVEAGVFVGENCVLGNNVHIEPNAVIKNDVTIGNNTHIFPNVTIYPEVIISENVIIHAGVTIGSDGFGYLWDGKMHRKIPQIGGVIIENNVEIGANACIDRGALGNTIIKQGTKLDNLIQVGHNVVIGKNSILCSQAGIAGSTEIGDDVILAGQVGVADHIKIGNRVKVAAQSGISKNVPDDKTMFGYPATEAGLQRRIIACMRDLPDIRKLFKKLKKNEEMND
ncbi:MAG: UDP-3-O-(3-hydroxymyristoyl)glucosamine N-acyltransferase [Candidatus Cloacimonadota bacterium]|nr:UDP-3-O-(3-hydroxymyristoyl)glucosamine N-acyltransferase [Candidatus Cloacimonadota bacterium]